MKTRYLAALSTTIGALFLYDEGEGYTNTSGDLDEAILYESEDEAHMALGDWILGSDLAELSVIHEAMPVPVTIIGRRRLLAPPDESLGFNIKARMKLLKRERNPGAKCPKCA